jgi:hypothetical protein
VLVIPSLGVSQLVSHLHQHRTAIKPFSGAVAGELKKKKLPRQLRTNTFSSAIAGEKEDFCKGSFARRSFTLF